MTLLEFFYLYSPDVYRVELREIYFLPIEEFYLINLNFFH